MLIDNEAKKKMFDKLDEFKSLKKGWDSYNSEPANKVSIELAKQSIIDIYSKIPFVTITGDGMVLFEWENLAIEFFPNDKEDDNVLGYLELKEEM